jgi:hypothetical protein
MRRLASLAVPLVLAAGGNSRRGSPRRASSLGSTPETRRRIVIPDANHVFKEGRRDPEALTPAQVGTSYVEEGRPLADGLVEAISSFVLANRK